MPDPTIGAGSELGDENPPPALAVAAPSAADAGGLEQSGQGAEADAEGEAYSGVSHWESAGDGGGGDSGSDLSDDENEGHLPPDHPLMQPLQHALFRQLTRANERLNLSLREKEGSLAKVKKKRETVGVELYSLQQGLAKLQVSLEKSHADCASTSNERTVVEKKLADLSQVYRQKLQEKEALEKKRKTTLKELDKLKVTVKQVDEFNEKVKSEILVTRRAAYGTEEAMQKLEKGKRTQDEQINSINEQLKESQDQIRIYEGQIQSQKQETKAAKEMLAEANKEMELIAVEKRDLMQKWRLSVVSMTQRDMALEAAEKHFREQQEVLAMTKTEIKGYDAAIKKEQVTNENLTGLLGRATGEIKFLDQQLLATSEERKELSEKFSFLRQSLETSEAQFEVTKKEQKELLAEIAREHKRYEKLTEQKQALDDTIMSNLSNQTTIEKGAQNVWKLTQKLKQQIHDQEIKIGDTQNELARIMVDALNTEAHNKELQRTMEAYGTELSEKDKLIEKYEAEIRQRHDKVEKKQIHIARLNRKYEQLTANKEDENTGPLEATIKNLRKETEEVGKNIKQLQREWINGQTELVTRVQASNEEHALVKEQGAKQTIIQQSILRMGNQLRTHKEEIAQLKRMHRQTHHDMAKLNELLHVHQALHENLQNQNFTMETDFMNKLKELELDSVKMDANIQRVNDERETLFNEIVEVEKQIMLWEKKIQLERETQDVLDPEYGQPEILGMKKEIHRMTLRLGQLKRQQERMISEMEGVIEKRESIQLANMVPSKKNDLTQAALKKKISALKASLKQNIADNKQVVGSINEQESQNQLLLAELERQQKAYNTVEDANLRIVDMIEDAYFKKQMNLEHLLLLRKRAQRFEEATEGQLVVTELQAEKAESELLRNKENFQQLQGVIARLKSENPKYSKWFDRLMTFRGPEEPL